MRNRVIREYQYFTEERNLRKMDTDQQAAVDCNVNSVVSAGAGSGKTTVLSRRYLRLVEEGRAGVENILTLTFTRKAAAEMYERIYSILLGKSSNPVVKKQLALFDKARISTLDSFCSSIARGWSQRFGIADNFITDNEETAKLAEDFSLAFILENQDDPALGKFIFTNGFEQVWKGYFKSLACGYLDVSEEKDFTGMYDRQISCLERTLVEKLQAIDDIFGKIGALSPESGKTIISAQEQISSIPELSGIDKRTEIIDYLNNVKFRLPSSSSKSIEALELRELITLWRAEKSPLLKIAGTLNSSELMRSLFLLTAKFQSLFLKEKREKGVLSFHDVAAMAVKTLVENREIRNFYKKKYRYIMIDEFQDNNLLQKQLLYLLAERDDVECEGIPGIDDLADDKLFFVGDEKQSIYKFRGADVSVFKKLSAELMSGAGVSLSRNYRSEPELIDFFNKLFPEVMKDPLEDYEAEFAPLLSRGKMIEDDPLIRLFYKPYNPQLSEEMLHGSEAEAWNIAGFIRESVESGSLSIPGDKGPRAAEYRDFCVLMRTTGNQIIYERMFRRAGIPYLTQSVRTLFLEAPLNDIYNLLQLAVYPDDKTAYAAFLRSPFVNLSDISLVKVLLSTEGPFVSDPDKMEIDGSDTGKYLKGRELYEFVRDKADFIPISELVYHLWYTYGYRYFILKNPSAHGYLEYYDYLEKMAADADSKSMPLALFLDFLRPNLGKYEKLPDLEIISEKKPGVMLLSIHKSKGLEFPVVILAGTGSRGRGDDSGSAPYYISDDYGVSLNIPGRTSSGEKISRNYFYTIGKEENDRKELAELKRLLYVALTRSESHLIISGCHNKNNRSSVNVHLNMIFNAFGMTADNCFQQGISPLSIVEIPDITEDDISGYMVPSRKIIPEDIARAYKEAGVIKQIPEITNFTATEINSIYWEDSRKGDAAPLPALLSDGVIEENNLAAVFGTLCHFIIEMKLKNNYSPDYLPGSVTGRIPEKDLQGIIDDAVGLSESFFLSSLGKRAVAAENTESELSFLYRAETESGEKFIRGQIDLFFEEDHQAVVIDFKTDKIPDIEAYSAQISIYREAARQFTDKKLHCYLFYLRNGSAVEITEEIDFKNGTFFN